MCILGAFQAFTYIQKTMLTLHLIAELNIQICYSVQFSIVYDLKQNKTFPIEVNLFLEPDVRAQSQY
jgi:hypothetical protein